MVKQDDLDMAEAEWQHPRSKNMSKVLIIGSGGREHAIVWAIKNTAVAPVEVFCAPGNAGIGQNAQLVNISVEDHADLASFAESNKIDLTFVGPEA
ncbi:MAG TPA: phosphoribosylamine--glycine ligase N-terminal domain-containing protein, partial [Pyrinomonadaceae bacterium]|nr:phosphoribosylamine--glycine ligase N-terminal domain-containing protein [Pyrinomonadaceae bacterium]